MFVMPSGCFGVQAVVYPFRISQEGFTFGSTQADRQNKEGVDK